MKDFSKTNTLIWDWNGTLIDDLEISVDAINLSLEKRNLPLLNIPRYLECFTFPVVEYYRNIGFDFEKEAYDKVADEFIRQYYQTLPSANLFPDVQQTLQFFSDKGFKQLILSAMEQSSLERSVSQYGITKYFDRIQGASDIFAYGKKHYLKSLLEETGTIPVHCCLIGDTLHDLEVAESQEIPCVLISRGHQSHRRLSCNNHLVMYNLYEFQDCFRSSL